MFIACWSVKGGSGTTVVASSLALLLGEATTEGALLVDLAGDVPAVLGLPEPETPGVAEWLAAGDDVPADGWTRLELPAAPNVQIVPRGAGPLVPLERVEVLCGLLAVEHRNVIVDCGVVGAKAPHGDLDAVGAFAASATHSLLVTRGSYVGLRLAQRPPLHPSGVVYVRDQGCALDGRDVADVIGAPVWAEVVTDPAVMRAVDAGMLAHRLPRALERALRHAA
jgi:hypothetical protein